MWGNNRTHTASVLRVQVLHGVQCTLRCLNGSSNVQIAKHAGSVSCSECLPLVTAVIFINIMEFGLGLCFCLSKSPTIFLLILHFKSLNIRIDLYIVFPSDSSSKFPNKCLTIAVLHSHPFPSHPLSNQP
jgi:hypothetical protein